ncbi:MAG: ATP-binding cassette domain-containing protein, partial [Actinomycetota bacterium]|nr:ATP-binding cassette domain-containing protein [Actinomycetota bacterium]
DRLARASPYHLSGGEQRRLMLAAALVHGPYAVLLDEPTVGQDRNTWAAVLGACAAARDAGSACALATHDLAAAGALADDRLVLSAGRVA